MVVARNIQVFLHTRLKELKLTRKDFIAHSGIDAPTVSKLCNARQLAPSIINIVKIADFFHCSVDEVLGRIEYIDTNIKYSHVTAEQISKNLKNFISHKLDILQLSTYALEKFCFIGSSTLLSFMNDDKSNRGLNIIAIVHLSDYFKISIDSLIGRSK